MKYADTDPQNIILWRLVFMFKGMNPILRAILGFALGFVLSLGALYLTAMIKGQTFTLDWKEYIISGVVLAVLTFVAPDAAQRKKNRQDLKDRFSGKK